MIFWNLSRLPPVAREEDLRAESERNAFRSFRSLRRRREWVAGRVAARRLIASVLEEPPDEVEIVPSPAGPPRARRHGSDLPLTLSLAHGGEWLLCAVRPGVANAPLGVDLEPLVPRRRQALWRALNGQEIERFAAADPDRLPLADLLQVWTIKEAVLKAAGRGLRLSPRRVTVSDCSAKGSFAPSSVLFTGRAVQVWTRRTERLAMAIGWLGEEPEEISSEPTRIDY
ncbi:MAG: 4'-phosphopantetheinyl transferase superfamily protein [Myxococcales bacterium]|nr:4'-phosphopantetheinyl transferase superfamily protein [Myxococcales bacterium]